MQAARVQDAEQEARRTRWALGLGGASLSMLLIVAGFVIERDNRNRERSRLAVARSEERFRLALDAAKAGAWEWDLETNKNIWSDELWKLYGLEAHSRTPSYDAWVEVLHPDDRANSEQIVAQAVSSGTELTVESRVVDKGGKIRWLLSRGRPLKDSSGRPARYTGIVLDITVRKQAEENLLEREQVLRRFAEFAPVAIAMLDRQLRYVAVSQRFRDDYKLGTEPLVGRGHYDVFPDLPPAWREVHRRGLAGEVLRNSGQLFERADGTQLWIRWEIQPWHDGDGNIGGIVLFSEDISHQVRAEQVLRESEARLRLAQQVARVGTFEWNIQTGVNTWTPELEAMYGLEPGAFVGNQLGWEHLVHPEDRAEAVARIGRAMETGKFEAEWRVIWPDGTVRWLGGRAWVFKDDAGKPLRLIGVNIDITEAKLVTESLRRTEAELREAQRVGHLGSWHWDLRSDTVTCSEETNDIFGLDPGLPFPAFRDRERLYTAESWKRVKAALENCLQTGAGYELDLEIVRGGGNAWITARAEALRDAGGNIISLHGTYQDITRRKAAEDEVVARAAVIQAIARVFSEAMTCDSEEALGRSCLRIAQALTGSRSGFIGETGANGQLNVTAITHSEEFVDLPKLPISMAPQGMLRNVLESGASLYTNKITQDPDIAHLPIGHARLDSFLGVPLVRAGKVIGMIAMANREGGYRRRDSEALDALAPAIVQVFMRRRAEEALRESEAQFRTLANSIPQLCWTAHGDGWIFWYNQRWYEYTGATAEQAEGWGWQSVHDPEALPGVLERWKSSISTGEPFEMVHPLKGADGIFRPYLTLVMPVCDRDGTVVRWFGTSTDISAQHRTELALRNASEQRRLALEAAELGSWDYRFDSGNVSWDPVCRNMFGIESGSEIDFVILISRIHPDDREGMWESICQALNHESGSYSHEYRVLWPDDSVHWIATHGRVYFEETGGVRRPVQFVGVNMDITRRKQAEVEIRQLNSQLEQRVRQRTLQLEAANRELESFAYSVSHDLRAPLRGIDGWSLALAEDYSDRLDERAHKYIGRVRTETQRMGMLIDDMLQLSRVNRSDMEFAAVDLTALAQAIAGDLTEASPDRRIEFLMHQGLRTQGDSRLMAIALTNLLANAVKFTGPREQARIEFGKLKENGTDVFYVRDNGVGFDMTYAASLFGAFQRLHKASEFPGTGIGLATVQRVIHRHGGKVWTEAKVDEGATFFFTIGEPFEFKQSDSTDRR